LLLCKNEKGNILTGEQQVLERWKQFFKEVLNNELTSEHIDREIEIKNLNEDVDILPPNMTRLVILLEN